MFNSCLFQLVHLSTPQPSTLLSPGSLPWLRRDPPGFTQVSPDSPRLPPGFAGSLSRLAVSISCVSHYTVFKVRFVLFWARELFYQKKTRITSSIISVY